MSTSLAPTPLGFFGFQPGDDRRLARWPQMVAYFQELARASDTVHCEEFGRTVEDRPMIVAYISSPENIARLDELKQIQRRLSDPRGLTPDEEAGLIAAGRAFVLVRGSIHPTEVGGTQMAPVLAYDLATRDDEQARHIRDNVVLVLIPSMNPDGLELVADWYERMLGTPAEGTWPPSITHKYVGGENNRDWFMLTQPEARHFVTEVFNQCFPQLDIDLHQMDNESFRYVLPPYVDPIDPNVDPLITAQAARFGTVMAARMLAEGLSGVANQILFDAYAPDRNYVQYHGGIHILTECASCDIATPYRIHPDRRRGIDGRDPRTTFANHPWPWTGTEWHLSDILRYNLAVCYAGLIESANNRQELARNFLTIQKRAIARDPNLAFVIPADQSDPVTTAELIETLRLGLVEVRQAERQFAAGGMTFPAGSYVIPLAQPFGGYARTLLERRDYPALYLYPGGPPRPPYDMSTSCLPLMMGIRAEMIAEPFAAELSEIERPRYPEGGVRGEGTTYLLSPASNAAALAVNRLLKSGGRVSRLSSPLEQDGQPWPAGIFVAQHVARDDLRRIAEATHTDWHGCSLGELPSRAIRLPRVGIYKPYMTGFGVCDEGWLRFVLDSYEFPYRTIHNENVRFDDLNQEFDVIILPQQLPRDLLHGFDPSEFPGLVTSERALDPGAASIANPYPPKYQGGIGERGGDNLRRFVEGGGMLISLDTASDVAIDALRLPVESALRGVSRDVFYNPGSLLRVQVDHRHPIGYGYGREAAVLFLNSPAFRLLDGAQGVVMHTRNDQLLSGWMLGAGNLKGLSALADVPVERGRAVLFGFRPHFRAQARGTYRLLFNTIYYGSMSKSNEA